VTTARLFVALAPPDDAKNELDHALQPVYAAQPGLRVNRIEDWHITLAFLGEQPLDVIPALRTSLADVAKTTRPLELRMQSAGQFDNRVLWTGIHGDTEGLRELSEKTRKAVRDTGVDFEERTLRPHLTLARARRGDPDGAARAAAALEGFSGRPWHTRCLHLVGSNIGRGPGLIFYRDLEAWPLDG
jgi:2'-5' RNA ligase